ncbi:MAG TPA: hypothetical protein PLG48_03995 [Candidatus Avimonas sp.]|nr:hypothetical protein [Clostridiales bacterium]HPU58655.1 hypothetical protein [Candidatus Avimonas sp.]
MAEVKKINYQSKTCYVVNPVKIDTLSVHKKVIATQIKRVLKTEERRFDG